jgi:hypothetical protein
MDNNNIVVVVVVVVVVIARFTQHGYFINDVSSKQF